MPCILTSQTLESTPQYRGGACGCRLFVMIVMLVACVAHADQTIRCQLADGFDFPVGKPDAHGYYKARGFSPQGHLGEDWDGVGGGDTDLGDPIYAMGRGIVVFSENVHQGWGNMVIIRHVYREPDGRVAMVDSLYGHALERLVKVGDKVERGQLIAKIGTNDGMYPAHLHFEVHKNLAMGPNRGGFAHDYSNYYSPTAFINAHRTCEVDFKKYDIPVDTFAPYGQQLNETQIKRGKSLSLPVLNGPATSLNKTTTPKTIPSTPGKTEAGEKGDFWSRLRSKLSQGTVTGGLEDNKK